MFLKVLKSKLHSARVTESDLHYEGSVAIDQDLLSAADIQPYESVHIWNVTNGSRLETYAIPAPAGSGQICVNGAAARHAMPGDTVIIATFEWIERARVTAHQPKIVLLNGTNRVQG